MSNHDPEDMTASAALKELSDGKLTSEALVSACPNQWLLRMRHMLYKQSERYRRLSVTLSTDQRDVRAEHRRIAHVFDEGPDFGTGR